MKALTVRQPWAWLIFNGKDVENRDWPTSHRGPLAIHAAKGMTRQEYEDCKAFVNTFDPELAAQIPRPEELVRGAVIGKVNLHTCTRESYSLWFQGLYGFMFSEVQSCEPVPAKGALGLWEWGGPDPADASDGSRHLSRDVRNQAAVLSSRGRE